MNIQFTNTPWEDVIELRGVSQSYNGGRTWVIQDLDLLIEDVPDQGQFIVILGRSGCGKSTILRYIAGLLTPTIGEVLVRGEPPEEHNQVSMVFQQYSSPPWYTVLENVALPLLYRGTRRNEREARAMEMIRLVGLEGHEDKLTTSPLLSGGQLQRVAIARSLIANPGVILMDEPFGALDTYTRFQMQELLVRVWEELHNTIVFVTHDIIEAVFLADDVYIMSSNPGQIVQHFHIDLDFHRDRAVKRSPRFTEIVHEIEDVLYNNHV